MWENDVDTKWTGSRVLVKEAGVAREVRGKPVAGEDKLMDLMEAIAQEERREVA